jgi:hypothetical protein
MDSSTSSWEAQGDYVPAMLQRVYGCKGDLAKDLPLAPSRSSLPPYNTLPENTQERRLAWDSVKWHADHNLVLFAPDPSKVHIVNEKRTILIDRHVRANAPPVTDTLSALLPNFITSKRIRPSKSTQEPDRKGLPPSSVLPLSSTSSASSPVVMRALDHFLPAFVPVLPPVPVVVLTLFDDFVF